MSGPAKRARAGAAASPEVAGGAGTAGKGKPAGKSGPVRKAGAVAKVKPAAKSKSAAQSGGVGEAGGAAEVKAPARSKAAGKAKPAGKAGAAARTRAAARSKAAGGANAAAPVPARGRTGAGAPKHGAPVNDDQLPAPVLSEGLFGDIRALVEQSRQRVARSVNSELVLLNWRVGERIRREVLGEIRAEYGKQIVESLADRLAAEFGPGYSRTNLFNMLRFCEVFPDFQIVQTLSEQSAWSHFTALIWLEDPLKREYYARMCAVERWSVRTLKAKVDGMLFERTAISRKPEALVLSELRALGEGGRMTPDLVFRDPYVLDYLNLKDTYSEEDLEQAILHQMERFLAELGSDFTFVARQKRITIDGQAYHIDLLFFHRRMRCLIAVDLKLGRFQAAYKGQMELYLRWLEKHLRLEHEERPLGLILCAGKSREHVELLQLKESGIRVAEYVTHLPRRAELEKKLHRAIAAAREQVAVNELKD